MLIRSEIDVHIYITFQVSNIRTCIICWRVVLVFKLISDHQILVNICIKRAQIEHSNHRDVVCGLKPQYIAIIRNCS